MALSHPGLAERGARFVGAWPAENPYDAFIDLLERRIASTTDDEHRSRLKKVRDGFVKLSGDVGTQTVSALLVELLKGLA